MGTNGKDPIYRLTDVHFISLSSTKYDQMCQTIWEDDTSAVYNHPCFEFIKWLSGGFFYFSNGIDLTRKWQRQLEEADQNLGKCYWDLYDERFFWNRYMMKKFLKIRRILPEKEKKALDFSGLLVMLTQGYVSVEQIDASFGSCSVGIISRLNCRRAGTRFNSRGIDDDGNVANFVETEAFVITPNHHFSYVQIRGSIPLFWEQQGIQVGNNKIQISRSKEATKPAFDKHFDEICEIYGRIHIIDLLGQQKEGNESILSNSYKELLDIVDFPDRIDRTSFDFHAVTKTYGFDAISSLEKFISKDMKQFGYLLFEKNTRQFLNLQKGVFRVNCLDCLDRTNVVESFICLKLVEDFFKHNTTGYYHHLLDYFKTLWANNGDALSMMYAGTGALKSGFTRTGRRTFAGFMDDMRKTATRFYINNFQDKSKQQVIDQLLGNLPDQRTVNIYNPVQEEVQRKLKERLEEYSTFKGLKVLVVTWNVNAQEYETIENLVKLFKSPDNSIPDIVAVGFQEIVELTPSQIMSSDPIPRKKWEAALIKALSTVYRSNDFSHLTSGQLVGASLSIFIRSDLVGFVRNVSSTIKKVLSQFNIKTGMGGMAGNKGAVGVRFDIFDSNICFVCCHFAAGQGNVSERNRDFCTISSGLVFSKGGSIDSHE